MNKINVLTQNFLNLEEEVNRKKDQLRILTDQFNEVEKAIREILQAEGVNIYEHGTYRIEDKETRKNIFDSKTFREEKPALYEKYKKEIAYCKIKITAKAKR